MKQLGPFAILAVAGLWLWRRFDELPVRLPVHWNATGNADRFIDRTPLGAAMPLLIGAGLCLLFLLIQLAVTPPPAKRLLLGVEYFFALLFCGILAAMATAGRMLAPVLVLSLAAAVILVVMALTGTREPPREPGTWRGGFFYVNPEDPALIVPKRYGIGYTFNYGHRLALPLTILLIAVPLAIAIVAVVTAR